MKIFLQWLMFAASCIPIFAADDHRILVGAAAIDITPSEPIRLNGYAVRKGPSEGVEQKLFGKAFAMGSPENGDLTLIITVDNLGVPASVVEKVYAGLSSQSKLAREQFAICASH